MFLWILDNFGAKNPCFFGNPSCTWILHDFHVFSETREVRGFCTDFLTIFLVLHQQNCQESMDLEGHLGARSNWDYVPEGKTALIQAPEMLQNAPN